MTWGGGFLDDPIGSIDFAGGNVIHISTGVSGLVACMILGNFIRSASEPRIIAGEITANIILNNASIIGGTSSLSDVHGTFCKNA